MRGAKVVEKMTKSPILLIITIFHCIMITNGSYLFYNNNSGAEWGTGVLHSLQSQFQLERPQTLIHKGFSRRNTHSLLAKSNETVTNCLTKLFMSRTFKITFLEVFYYANDTQRTTQTLTS
jgi:hypothetical protein